MRRSIAAGLGLLMMVPGLAALAPGAGLPSLPEAPDVVRIVRDGYGIPHVYAATREGLAFGAGVASAEDRLFQGEVFRRAGKGTLAEMLGPSYLAYDLSWRTLKYTEAERWQAFLAMPEDIQRMVWAYCAGINAHIAAALADPANKLPVEFAALGQAPAPWTPTDFVAIVQLEVDSFGEGGGGELGNAAFLGRLVQRLGPEAGWAVFNDAKWRNDPGAPTTLPGAPAAVADGPPPAWVLGRAAEGWFERPLADLEALTAPLASAWGELGLPKWGSNAFLASPALGARGFALQYGGPQVGYNIPALFLELGLHGAGIDAVGLSFMGVGPFLPIGHSAHLAWTTTSGVSDEVDSFLETIRPHPEVPEQYQYLFRGAWRDMERRLEVAVARPGPLDLAAGQQPAVASKWVYRTAHGPVVSLDPAGGLAVSRQSAFWMRELETGLGFARYQEARTPADYIDATRRIVSSHNILIAGSDGHTYYAHAGLYPVRAEGVDPRLPALGTGEHEWTGFLPFEAQPQALDPDQGWAANWNNKPRPDWPDGDDTAHGVEHRVRAITDRIAALLAEDGSLSVVDFEEVGRHAAVAEWVPSYFEQHLRDARPLASPQARAAIDRVLAWDGERRDADGDGRYDGAAITIFREFFEQVRRGALAAALGGDLGRGGASMVLHVLDGAQASLPPRHDYLRGKPAAQVVAEAVEATLPILAARHGTADVDRWLTAVRIQRFSSTGAASVPSIPWQNRGSYVQVVELSPLPRGQSVNPPGQSGLVNATMLAAATLAPGTPYSALNPHLDDQRLMYRDYRYKPMLLAEGDVRAAAASETVLAVPGLPPLAQLTASRAG